MHGREILADSCRSSYSGHATMPQRLHRRRLLTVLERLRNTRARPRQMGVILALVPLGASSEYIMGKRLAPHSHTLHRGNKQQFRRVLDIVFVGKLHRSINNSSPCSNFLLYGHTNVATHGSYNFDWVLMYSATSVRTGIVVMQSVRQSPWLPGTSR